MKKVWINGCFDVIHRGHVELFKYASSLGDFLVVGIDTDERVRANKGSNRPFNSLEDRIFVLESIKYIDDVVHFSSDRELEDQIKKANPDMMIVGSDWENKKIIGGQLVENLLYFKRVGDYSTTRILEDQCQRRS
jgi:rfaE bifunctional protein nucleotidyltransferase chain/domain